MDAILNHAQYLLRFKRALHLKLGDAALLGCETNAQFFNGSCALRATESAPVVAAHGISAPYRGKFPSPEAIRFSREKYRHVIDMKEGRLQRPLTAEELSEIVPPLEYPK